MANPAQEPKTFRRTFEAHGIEFYPESGDGINFIADCPFSGKEKKLYVNIETGQWDSKSAGKSGNHYTFMRELYDWAFSQTTEAHLMELAIAKRLPVSAFLGEIAKNPLNGRFLIPEYNHEGKITGLGSYFVGSKGVFRTPNTNVQLNGAHEVKPGQNVYICEGEWDYFALKWLLKFLGKEDRTVVCVPGAGTFKEQWVPIFKETVVHSCYDNDDPGRKGERKAHKMLAPIATQMRFLRWSPELTDGYDVRDLITTQCRGKEAKGSANAAFMTLQSLFKRTPNYKILEGGEEQEHLPVPKEEEAIPDIELNGVEDVEKAYGKWLSMSSFMALDVMFGTIFANRIVGDPVWTFLVAPPGGTKTELLMTLTNCPEIETTTTLTAPALISGIKFPEGEDPSLLIQVNEKVLVIKDFTTIISMNTNGRDEVFGILRDVYDGYVEKYFGTGIKKSYHSKFGILAGVTPAIDAVAARESSLGERFLKYRSSRADTDESEILKIRRALLNVGDELKMRRELQATAKAVLKKELPEVLPTISEEYLHQVTALAMFTATMRGSVTKDQYSGEMLCMPVREVGTRLAKQLSKLARGVCVYRGLDAVDEHVMSVIRTVAIDTCPDRMHKLGELLYTRTKDGSYMKTKDVVAESSLSDATISRLFSDLMMMGVIEKSKSEGLGNGYRLTKRIRLLIEAAGVYQPIPA